MKTVWVVVFIAIALTAAGCTFGSDDQPDIPVVALERSEPAGTGMEEIRFTQAVEFQDSLFIEIIPSVDTDRHGNLYVAAERHRTRVVYKFSPEGELQDTIGGFGNEAGKFESIRDIQISGDTLFVFDDRLNRATLFDISDNQLIDITEYENIFVQFGDESIEFFSVPIWHWTNGKFLIELQDRRNPAIFYQ